MKPIIDDPKWGEDCAACGYEMEMELPEEYILYLQWLEDKVKVLTQGIQAWEAANTIATAAHKAVHGKNSK